MTSWRTLLVRFGILGLTGFGGPPAHLVALRRTWVESGEIADDEFKDALASSTLLPGPTSTQMAMWVGWRTRGALGATAAALLFITPAVVLVTALTMSIHSNQQWGHWVLKGATGATWMMPAIVLFSTWVLIPESIKSRQVAAPKNRNTFVSILVLAAVAEQFHRLNPVVIILAAGGFHYIRGRTYLDLKKEFAIGSLSVASMSLAGLALKIGLLSVGGGFIIVPIMRADAVTTHHWMSEQIFVVLVAIGQLTPGPVFSTIAAIGYYADGIRGAAIGAVLAFLPSYLMVVFLAPKLQRVRDRADVKLFFWGALPASTGLILGTAPFFTAAINQWVGAVFAVAGLVALFSKKVPVVVVLLVGVAAGLVLAHP